MKKQRRKAFTLVELLIAMVFLGVALLGILSLISSANRQTMDTYNEFMAMQLALEPIEIFRSFGYSWVLAYSSHSISEFPLGWSDIMDQPLGPIIHPAEAIRFFQREISISEVSTNLNSSNTLKGVKVTVRVSPKEQTKVAMWLSRNEIKVETIIWERPAL
ncbi:MAG: hypothetical protein HQM08_01210 [Candidatus Riflebacteria bacterium]|nr:hypothetical protein [Candidatus Riflebacteria bacterium]